jgi:OOP family OmpA-OmpF porin
MQQPKLWWIGLPIVAGLVYYAADPLTRQIEDDLSQRVSAQIAGAPGAIEHARVAVLGRDATVSGLTLKQDEKDRVLAAARREDGVRSLADATQTLGVASPYVLTIERQGAQATLSGATPPTGEREALVAALRALGLEVVDKTLYANGAPAHFIDIATYAARALGAMARGQATLSDAALTLVGEAKSPADYERILAAAKTPPQGARLAKFDLSPPRVSPYVWSAARQGDMVTLAGYIPANELRPAINARAATTGAGVSDGLQVAAGAPEGDYAAAVDFALGVLGKLTQGKVSLVDGKFAVEGQGRANVQAATLEAEAKAGLPHGYSLAKIDVAPGAASPYTFAAQKSAGVLTLSGHVGDEAAHEKIVALARRVFFDARLANNAASAAGAPAHFAEAVEAALPALARLESGRFTLGGGQATLEGFTLYERAAADIEQRLAAALPPGFKLETQLHARTLGSSMDVEHCRAAFADVLARGALALRHDQASVDDVSAPVLDALAVVALRCPDVAVEVAAYTDAVGIEEVNRNVTQRLAQSVIDWLTRAGVNAAKLTPVGLGAEHPTAPNDSDDGRAKNRRIEFVVK